MNLARTVTATFWIAALALWAQEPTRPPASKPVEPRFTAMDVFVDSSDQPLAAYQLELVASGGGAKIVGIEGGEHPAFNSPPYYDPKAMQQERAVIAAFNTAAADKLPSGRTRVATIHIQISGGREPRFEVKLRTAAASDGRPISVQTSFKERTTR